MPCLIASCAVVSSRRSASSATFLKSADVSPRARPPRIRDRRGEQEGDGCPLRPPRSGPARPGAGGTPQPRPRGCGYRAEARRRNARREPARKAWGQSGPCGPLARRGRREPTPAPPTNARKIEMITIVRLRRASGSRRRTSTGADPRSRLRHRAGRHSITAHHRALIPTALTRLRVLTGDGMRNGFEMPARRLIIAADCAFAMRHGLSAMPSRASAPRVQMGS
jgi:hypothetical protein